ASRTNQYRIVALAAYPQFQALGWFLDLTPPHPIPRPPQNSRPIAVSQTASVPDTKRSTEPRQPVGSSVSRAEPKKDCLSKLLLLTIAVLLALNLLAWFRPTPVVAEMSAKYKMLVMPTNADGVKAFEEATNRDGFAVESFHIAGQERNTAVAI